MSRSIRLTTPFCCQASSHEPVSLYPFAVAPPLPFAKKRRIVVQGRKETSKKSKYVVASAFVLKDCSSCDCGHLIFRYLFFCFLVPRRPVGGYMFSPGSYVLWFCLLWTDRCSYIICCALLVYACHRRRTRPSDHLIWSDLLLSISIYIYFVVICCYLCR